MSTTNLERKSQNIILLHMNYLRIEHTINYSFPHRFCYYIDIIITDNLRLWYEAGIYVIPVFLFPADINSPLGCKGEYWDCQKHKYNVFMPLFDFFKSKKY